MTTPWGLINAVYPIYNTGRRRLSSSGEGHLARLAARALLQQSSAGNGSAPAAEPAGTGAGLLPANSSIDPNYDADQTQLGGWGAGCWCIA